MLLHRPPTASCSETIRALVTVRMCCLMTLSMAFISRDVRATGLKSFRVVILLFFGMGMTGVFPKLRDCAGVHGSLKPLLEHSPLLLSTEFQDPAADVVWARRAILPGPPEGSHHLLCFKDKLIDARFQ